MPEDHKVFDISRPGVLPQQPTAVPTSVAAPTVVHQIPVSVPGAPAQAAEAVTEAPTPEITSIPVSQAPPPVINESSTPEQPAPSTVTPALPGAVGYPAFGELQAKVDAHPLFSGQTEGRVKVRRRFPRFALPAIGLIVFAALAFLFVSSSAGESYLPFHILKQSSATQPVIAPVKVVTNPVVTTPVSLVPDSYNGWNTNCVKALKACIKTPPDWVANQYNGYENQAQTQYAALSLENVKDQSKADALIVSVDDFVVSNSNLKVVGLIVSNKPSYAVYDTSYINSNGIKPGATVNILVGSYTFSGSTGMASLVGSADTNGTKAITTVDAARAWFVSADAQQVFKVVRSFYYQ